MISKISKHIESVGDFFHRSSLFLEKRKDRKAGANLPHVQYAGEALKKLISDFEFETVLDVGCGAGEQAEVFIASGKKVTAIDYGESVYFRRRSDQLNAIIGDINTYDFRNQFDCVWCSHVLEHQLNPHSFLKRIHSLVKEDGTVCITVPPLTHMIVGGHASLWNAGLLLYHLVLAGFDCQDAKIRTYGYNISVIIRKKTIDVLSEIEYDSGDVRKIRKYLPRGLAYHATSVDDLFEGRIRTLNW